MYINGVENLVHVAAIAWQLLVNFIGFLLLLAAVTDTWTSHFTATVIGYYFSLREEHCVAVCVHGVLCIRWKAMDELMCSDLSELL